ncbi:MAG: hypothetical protein RMY36_019720 [Nostoc sp. SerVER01]
MRSPNSENRYRAIAHRLMLIQVIFCGLDSSRRATQFREREQEKLLH